MNTPSFFTVLLAKLLDTFKIKNPTAFKIVATTVLLVNLIINEAVFQSIFANDLGELPDWLKQSVAIVSAVYLLLANMGTYQIKKADEAKF